MRTTCAVCGVNAQLRCAKCHVVHYCSREHQQANWATHKLSCGQDDVIRSAYNILADTVALNLDVEITTFDRFACKRFQVFVANTHSESKNMACAIIAEGEILMKMLALRKTRQTRLAVYYLFLLARIYHDAGCEKEAALINAQLKLNGIDFPSFPVPTSDKISAHMKVDIPSIIRPQTLLLEGLCYFQSKRTTNNVKITLNAAKGGFDVLANTDFKIGDIVYEEEACLVSSVDYSHCHHCIRKVNVNNMQVCRKQCGLVYCSQKCEVIGWNMYHEPLCDEVWITNYKKMCDHILNAAKSSSGKFPLLHFKLLGISLKTGSHDFFKQPPFCYFHIGKQTMSLSALPTCLKYVLNVITSPHVAYQQVPHIFNFCCFILFRCRKVMILIGF